MFKTRNNQHSLANQQPLNEIELISGQEMVELDSQELMNVVGGKNPSPSEPPIVGAKAGPINATFNDAPPGVVTVSGDPPKVTTEPYTNN